MSNESEKKDKKASELIITEGKAVLTPLGATAGSVANKLLDPPAEELGQMFGDIIKITRSPISFVRHKVDKFLEEVMNKVPEENRVQPPLALVGPVAEGVRYQDPDSPLYSMFAELLARACDIERLDEAHPAYIDMIKQMTADEAYIIKTLSDENKVIYCSQYVNPEHDDSIDEIEIYEPPKGRKPIIPLKRSSLNYSNRYKWIGLEGLKSLSHTNLYYEHLKQLGLVNQFIGSDSEEIWVLKDVEPTTESIRIIENKYTLSLTIIGNSFAKACIPQWRW